MNSTSIKVKNSYIKLAPISIESKQDTEHAIVKSKAKTNPPTLSEKIAIAGSDGYEFLTIKDILYLKADGNYTEIWMIDGSHHYASKCLKNFVPYLEPNNFCRIHSAFLINVSHVKCFQKGGSPSITMDNGHKLKVSRTGKQAFMATIKWLI
jgi:two-component system LytT family response regulator